MDKFRVIREKRILPLIPLRGLTIFPHMVIHFDVGRDKSVSALENAIMNDSIIFLTTQKQASTDIPGQDDYYQVGSICRVKQMLKLPGDSIRVLVEGISRGKILSLMREEPFIEAEIEELKFVAYDEKDVEIEALMRMVMDNFEEYVRASNRVSNDAIANVSDIKDPGRFADVVASYIYLKPENKQKILEKINPYERLMAIDVVLKEEIEVLELEEELTQKVKSQINKLQKEYYLKEQLKAIHKELGEEGGVEQEVEEYHNRAEKIKMPEEIREKFDKELARLSKMHPSSAETGVIRTYIEWILDLPWDKETKDRTDLKKSRIILDEDHYGLKDVKERILEYLAVRKLTKSMKGPIICLVGPPGVGKTSIARSIARSLDREFVRMSLGGVRDEAEIRGHRRTYVGAIPGRIISGLKKAGCKNPVFLLDEIDKLNSDFRGDPASALLEVLDPEQNGTFTDHYMELPFDLSKVLFITTANSAQTIPGPLLDRMEIIEVSSYTEEEKYQIAKRYLIPKQIKNHGIKEKQACLSDNAVVDIIRHYTREAGVRGLEKQIANVMRKVAIQLVEEKKPEVRVSTQNLHKFLGVPKYLDNKANKENQVGIVNGLAWTSIGGVTLSIEVTPMKGTGKIQLTGKLGDVMKESAMAGISYIRSVADKYNIPENFHSELDLHIHIPEGATPKDGPSAGITMATAVLSALTETPVHADLAMTGEVTLRGHVLPIGGVKEKVLAAHRVGITKVLLPKDNEKDLEHVPEDVRKKMTFVFVETMEDVLAHALVQKGKRNVRRKKD